MQNPPLFFHPSHPMFLPSSPGHQLSEKLGHFVFLHVRRHNTDIMRDDASYLRCRHLDRDTRLSEKLGHFVFLHVRRHNTDIMRDDASYLRCRRLDCVNPAYPLPLSPPPHHQLSEKLGHFVFLHVRRHNTDIMRDDASYLRCRHLDRDTRVPAIRRHIWRLIPENSTLYIATDEVNQGFFSGLKQWYDIRLARSFDHILKGKVTNNYQVFAIEKHLSKFASFFVATFCDEADSYDFPRLIKLSQQHYHQQQHHRSSISCRATVSQDPATLSSTRDAVNGNVNVNAETDAVPSSPLSYDSPPAAQTGNGASPEFPQPVSGLSFSERKFGPLAEVPPEEYDLAVAERAVQLSCRLTQRVQDQLRRAEDVARSKKDKSFVTVADWGVQAVVSWVLKQAYPDEPISMVAEEDTKELTGQAGVAVLQRLVQTVNECLAEAALVGIPPPEAPLTAVQVLQAISRGGSEGGAEGRHWVLDPVDGTLGFVRDDQYAVALALLQDGQLKVGALGCPNFPVRSGWLRHPHRFHRLTAKYFPPTKWHKGFVLKAQREGGAWMESLVEIGRDGGALRAVPVPVRVSPVRDAALATFCEPVEKANSNQSFTAELADTLGISNEPLRVYSMAKYAAIARGDAEIFMKFARGSYKEKIWDHAAGVIIVEEAGGVVTDAGGNPLDFSKGRFLLGLDRGIMATNGPEMHEQLLSTVDASWSASRL
ncbi:unnamed protein product [Closterium sp. Yama58-4]|nr:unnamed protein product [Closterium sp. Yama58-4]